MICVLTSMRGGDSGRARAVRSPSMASSRRSATDVRKECSRTRAVALAVSTFAGRGPRSCFVFRAFCRFGGVLGVARCPVSGICFARCFAVRHAELHACCFPFRGFLLQTGHRFSMVSR